MIDTTGGYWRVAFIASITLTDIANAVAIVGAMPLIAAHPEHGGGLYGHGLGLQPNGQVAAFDCTPVCSQRRSGAFYPTETVAATVWAPVLFW